MKVEYISFFEYNNRGRKLFAKISNLTNINSTKKT